MAAGLTFALVWRRSSGVAQTDGFSEGQVKTIEKIVKDYLVNHPEIMTEVQEAYERKAEAARADATRAHLPVFYSALASMKVRTRRDEHRQR